MKRKNKAVFFDRDGTLSEEVGYITDISMFSLYPYTSKVLKELAALDYKIFVVTNQAGVARGYFNTDMVEKVHELMKQKLVENGAFIDEIYYSPYYKKGRVQEYSIDSDCRKPNTGMIEKAAKKYNIDLKNSIMIGDKLSDIECGRRSGLKTILLLTGHGPVHRKMIEKEKIYPDFITDNLETALNIIKGFSKNAES
ncbi:D-glycero-alpha-D-manno-heptose-1,7-bisphosphate 7-phosphatase [candidate division KSB1 bacterium]